MYYSQYACLAIGDTELVLDVPSDKMSPTGYLQNRNAWDLLQDRHSAVLAALES